MRKWIVLLFMLSCMTFLMTGCGSESTDTKEPTRSDEAVTTEDTSKINKDRLVIAMETPVTLHPLYNTQKSVQQSLYLIFSPLVNIEEDGTISSALAQSWMMNETNTAVTITLRQGVTWHDGMPVTVDDVIYTLNQIKTIADCPYKEAVANIQDMVKIDETTFKLVYKQEFSGALQTLFFPVIPEHIYNVSGEDALDLTPVGSGPYKYDSTTPLKSIALKANASYFNGEPQIKTIQIDFIPDHISMLYAFKQGLIDVIYTDETEWGKYTNNKASTAYEVVMPVYEFMGVNHNKVIFQNPAIRQALLCGINRQEMVHLLYLDHAVVTDTPISPVSYLYDRTLEIQTYDKEKAKLLLTQEGYERDGSTGLMTKNGVALSFNLLVNKENGDRVKVANQIKAMYKEIGIEVNIEELEAATYLERIQTRQYDAFLGGYQLSYATDLSFALHSSSILNGVNYVGYQNEKMDELLQQAFLANEKTIYEHYQKLQKYFIEQAPFISLYFKKSVLITRNDLSGNIKITPNNIFAYVEKWVIK